MQQMKAMTKKDIIELIEKNFKDTTDNEIIASLFECKDSGEDISQQCLMFWKEVK